ncbi:uncharacterized protein A4U43_C08F23420, partial [Asparagus officinalis]
MDDIMELLKDNFIWESSDEDPKNPGFKMPVNMMFFHRWCTLTVQSAVRMKPLEIYKMFQKRNFGIVWDKSLWLELSIN